MLADRREHGIDVGVCHRSVDRRVSNWCLEFWSCSFPLGGYCLLAQVWDWKPAFLFSAAINSFNLLTSLMIASLFFEARDLDFLTAAIFCAGQAMEFIFVANAIHGSVFSKSK